MNGIEIEGLIKRFPRGVPLLTSLRHPLHRETITALDGVDLSLEPGAIYGLVGSNGAGKTTLLKILTGLVLPTAGRVRVCGIDVAVSPRRVREVVGFVVADERSFYWRLSVRENLRFFATLQQIPVRARSARVEECLDLVGLREHAGRAFRELSTGLRQRLAIARGILADPDVLLMDEATRSLDPSTARRVRELVRTIARSRGQRTVVYSTHVLSEVEDLCDELIVLEAGRLVARQRVHEPAEGGHFRLRTRRPLPPDLGEELEGVSLEHLSETEIDVHLASDAALDALLDRVREHGLLELSPRRTALEDLVLGTTGKTR